MKKQLTSVCAVLVLASSLGLRAAEAPAPKPSSPEFERMKSLAGTWQGKTDMGQGRLTSP